jgi:hypothetical protein
MMTRRSKSVVGILVCILAVVAINHRIQPTPEQQYVAQTAVIKAIRAVVPGDKYITITFNDLYVSALGEAKALFDAKVKGIEALAEKNGIVLPEPQSSNYYVNSNGGDAAVSLGGSIVYRFKDTSVAETFAKILSEHKYNGEISDGSWGCGG